MLRRFSSVLAAVLLAALGACVSNGAVTVERPADKFVLVTQSEAAAGKQNLLIEAALQANAAAEGQPGLVEYQVYRPLDERGPILVVSTWESQDAFETWLKTDACKEVRATQEKQKLSTHVTRFGGGSFTRAGGWRRSSDTK